MTRDMIFGLLGTLVITSVLSVILFWIISAGGSSHSSGSNIPYKSSLEMQLDQQHEEEKIYHEAMMQSMRDNMYRDEMSVHDTSHAIGDALKDVGNMLDDLSR